jgi:uncharacterized protein YjbI with pentapeptide repeats
MVGWLTSLWDAYKANREDIAPLLAPLASFLTGLLTVVVAGFAAWIALRQARIATQQAQTARLRHEEQTNADRQRRITESFTKAVEQLGSDKLQVRLGGIYTLERLSRESEPDYWPVMETLTAFARDQARWQGEDTALSQTVARLRYYPAVAPRLSDYELPTDITAILTVIKRRDAQSREREQSENWRLDLSSTDLKGANLGGTHLERAILTGVHLEAAYLAEAHLDEAILGEAHLEKAHLQKACLERAYLAEAHLDEAILVEARLGSALLLDARLEGALLNGAHLERTILLNAHLKGANLLNAHLEGANLGGARLEGAIFGKAHLEGANLTGARLEGTDLREVTGLVQAQIDEAFGNAATKLPEGLARPPHWPQ